LQEQGCSELKLQPTEVEVSKVKLHLELPPITLQVMNVSDNSVDIMYIVVQFKATK